MISCLLYKQHKLRTLHVQSIFRRFFKIVRRLSEGHTTVLDDFLKTVKNFILLNNKKKQRFQWI